MQNNGLVGGEGAEGPLCWRKKNFLVREFFFIVK
jgi:hypothetical protein